MAEFDIVDVTQEPRLASGRRPYTVGDHEHMWVALAVRHTGGFIPSGTQILWRCQVCGDYSVEWIEGVWSARQLGVDDTAVDVKVPERSPGRGLADLAASAVAMSKAAAGRQQEGTGGDPGEVEASTD